MKVSSLVKIEPMDLLPDIRPSGHKEIARDANNALIRPASGRGRQFRLCGVRNVYADNSKVAVCQFPNIRTIVEGNRHRPVCVRVQGMSRGAKVCRDERLAHEPNLQTALAYEAIYQKSIRELFAGLYERIEREVAGRAKILGLRKDRGKGQQAAHRRQILADLATRQTTPLPNPSQI